ncbi:tetratricopeptide repeat protein [Rhodospirillaceae bacterium KN72]|uniref:Tetratricopeptide repeat protein n=1 Tax=Pacificispira spongiicola TaxID=2729598 RepID=A0A7Y0HF05_9PROT|nr:tetratricopeptide repeat protein [Pacificispira spongiicola]NMM45275.1 tetratricopeptide repeat protein [Pacificispira spongiicola]
MSAAASQKRLLLVREAVAAFQAGDIATAETLFRKAAADIGGKRNDDPRIPYNYAVFLRRTGRPQDAVYWLDRCLRMAPDHTNASIEKGLALIELGQAQPAIDLLTAFPGDADALRGLSIAAFKLGQWDRALGAVTALPMPQAEDRLLAIRALAELGRLSEAEADGADLAASHPTLKADIAKALTRRSKGRFSLHEPA